jgi:hypothetical protein
MGRKPKNTEPTVRVYVPALAQLLADAERTKGSPLSGSEISSIRAKAIYIILPQSGALELAHGRGFHDINPERAIEEWPLLRHKFSLD